jgi:hypothetical protein
MSKYSNGKIEKEVKEEIEEVTPYKYDITSYGADFDVDGLVKRIRGGDISVPKFQRGFVWTYSQASRFVESLLLGLPVPGVFFSREYGSQKLVVIDGQQRLRSLQYFYDGVFEPTRRAFVLKDVQEEFQGVTYKTLKIEDRRRLDDSIIHATIVKQDKPEEDNSSIYYIFERLNTGGTLLMPQEIRACIFQGEFIDLLKQLNDNKVWRSIYGKANIRMRDQELILRYFAFFFNAQEYSRPMKSFLNRFTGRNRRLQLHTAEQLTALFENAIETAYSIAGNRSFKLQRGVLASLFDSLMVGLSRRLERGSISNIEKAKASYLQLMTNLEYRELLMRATADEKNVSRRLEITTNAFADIE